MAALLVVSTGAFLTPGGATPAASSPDPPRANIPARALAVAHEPLPDVVPWRASEREPRGEVKEAAARLVEVAGSWAVSGGGAGTEMRARLAAAGYPRWLAGQLAQLHAPRAAAAVTQVVNPQYAGLTATDASVLVRVLQTLAGPGGTQARELVLDLRMGLAADGRWTVTAAGVPRSLGTPVPVGPLGRSVLENPRLLIPEPGRADIATGRVDDRVLSILDTLSRPYRVEVQVITTGHHGLVWGTPRTSNHAVGRAVDVWRIDGRAVNEADPSAVREFMVAAARAGATEVGGPVPVAGTGFFTDDVHSDHIHIGVNPARAPATPVPLR